MLLVSLSSLRSISAQLQTAVSRRSVCHVLQPDGIKELQLRVGA